jgi:hypothetical protein
MRVVDQKQVLGGGICSDAQVKVVEPHSTLLILKKKEMSGEDMMKCCEIIILMSIIEL